MHLNIIGGSGFIGTKFINFIRNKSYYDISIIDKVCSLTHSSITKIGDVRSLIDLRNTLTSNSIIINLAAEHKDNVTPTSLYYDVNVEGAKNICKVASELGINKIIFTSTVAVYGFADIGIDEHGKINPYHDYGISKYEAERIFTSWQSESPNDRSLIIIRPTVVFGEQNRGNVYNLFSQIATGKFAMIGSGENRKSMAYVDNLAAFIEYSLNFPAGIHIYNFVDKPDLTMNDLVSKINLQLGRSNMSKLKIPYLLGLCIGYLFDFASAIFSIKFTVSSIRIKKFCSNSVFDTSIAQCGFKSPISLDEAINKTVQYEFIDPKNQNDIFISK
jgi:nucleoside-diphosphate-sugar epimerase